MPFEKAYRQTKRFEGGYAWVKGDSGGETFRGITRRSHPGWPGWPKVDEAKSQAGIQPKEIDKILAKDPQIDPMVELLYRAEYWDPLGELPDLIKMKLFDMSVNMGRAQAVKLLQAALADPSVKADGALGPITRGAAAKADPAKLLERMRQAQAGYYRDLARRKPANAKFLAGWLARAEWVPEA